MRGVKHCKSHYFVQLFSSAPQHLKRPVSARKILLMGLEDLSNSSIQRILSLAWHSTVPTRCQETRLWENKSADILEKERNCQTWEWAATWGWKAVPTSLLGQNKKQRLQGVNHGFSWSVQGLLTTDRMSACFCWLTIHVASCFCPKRSKMQTLRCKFAAGSIVILDGNDVLMVKIYQGWYLMFITGTWYLYLIRKIWPKKYQKSCRRHCAKIPTNLLI